MKKITFLGFLLLLLAVVSSCSDPSLNDYVDQFKAQMPQDLGNGLVMNDIGIVDNYLQLDCTSDESELDLSNPMINMVLPALAESIKGSFVDNSDMKELMQACSDEGKGFRMMINGAKSGKQLQLFEVTPEDLNAKYPPRTKE